MLTACAVACVRKPYQYQNAPECIVQRVFTPWNAFKIDGKGKDGKEDGVLTVEELTAFFKDQDRELPPGVFDARSLAILIICLSVYVCMYLYPLMYCLL